jgi:hypothetical protein
LDGATKVSTMRAPSDIAVGTGLGEDETAGSGAIAMKHL